MDNVMVYEEFFFRKTDEEKFQEYKSNLMNNKEVTGFGLRGKINQIKKICINIIKIFDLKSISGNDKVLSTSHYYNQVYQYLINVENDMPNITDVFFLHDLKTVYVFVNDYSEYFNKDERKFLWKLSSLE